MAKFCGKCGSKLDEATGLCPNCDVEKLAKLSVESAKEKEKQKVSATSEKTLSKKEIKKLEKAAKKAKKMEKKVAMTAGQKVWRFLLKLIAILLMLVILVAGVVGILMYFGIVDIPIMSSVLEKLKFETHNSTTVFNNGDCVSTPRQEHIGYDAETNALYFDNQLIVYTFADLKQEDADGLAKIIGGEIVGDISGSINALQIRVAPSTLDELESMANKLMESEDVLYAGYDYPMQPLPSTADSNPWSADGNNPETNRGNENAPGGNDWWAEAIGAYTAWDCSEQCQQIKVGILDSGFDTNHEDLNGSVTFLPNYSTNSETDHGTHVAGIIGANNNSVGIRGIADSAQIVCLDWSPTESISYLSTGDYIEIIKQMVEADVKVINNSWGNYFQSEAGYMLNLYWDKDGYYEEINNRYIRLNSGENNSIEYEFKGDSKDNVQFFVNQKSVTYEEFIRKVKEGCLIRLVTENSKVKEVYYIKDDYGYFREQLAVKFTGAYDSYIDYCETLSKRTGLECTLMMVQLMLNENDDFLIVQAAGNGYDNGGTGVDTHYSAFFCAINSTIYDILSNSTREKLARQGIDYNAIEDRVLIVGAVKNEYDIKGYSMTQFSNFGKNVDICAPGQDIYSTLINSSYGELSGTSMAAPMVAGSAAFIWSLKPGLSAPEVRNILLSNTVTQAYGVGNGAPYTYPMLNVGAATHAVLQDTVDAQKFQSDAVEFNGHYYYVYDIDTVADWNMAQEYCEARGGYLATITSAEEDAFLHSYIVNAGYKSVMFGLTDQDKTDDWGWVTGELFSYQNWHSGEPNHQDGYEHYGMYYEKNMDGTWNDGSGRGVPFICEWGEYIVAPGKEPAQESVRTTSDERDIVLVLDVSGSMAGTPMEETKKASTNFVETILEEDASIGIVTYDNAANRATDFSVNKNSLESVVSGIRDGGGTNIESGLMEANSMLNSSNAKKKIIVLMSDGEPNDGKEGDELVACANEIKSSGVIIYTLGFFENIGGAKSSAQVLLERIASDGCHYEVANADDLVFFFGDIADQLNGQKYIYVRIACPVDVSVTYEGQTLNSAESDLNLRTDFGTLTFEENEEAKMNGTDDRVKVLRLKEGTDYDLQIVGTGHGLMDYTIGFMDDEGNYSDLRKFEDIKITKRTVIDTVAETSKESTLNIDENGDGKYDLRLRAEENGYGEEIKQDYLMYIMVGGCAVLLFALAYVVHRVRTKRKGKVK